LDTKALDRNERALDRLYRSLQANHGRPGSRKIQECFAKTTLESAIEDLISWMADERGFSVNYQINIRQSLERFAHWIRENGDKSVTAIGIEDLTSFLAYEKRRGLASGSLRQITIALENAHRHGWPDKLELAAKQAERHEYLRSLTSESRLRLFKMQHYVERLEDDPGDGLKGYTRTRRRAFLALAQALLKE
jgi:site-specific recombinase XerD